MIRLVGIQEGQRTEFDTQPNLDVAIVRAVLDVDACWDSIELYDGEQVVATVSTGGTIWRRDNNNL